MKAHCSVCGREFESAGTIGSALAAVQAERRADPETAELIRERERERLYPCSRCEKACNPASGSWCDECIEAASCACRYDGAEDRFDPCEEHAPPSGVWQLGAWPGA